MLSALHPAIDYSLEAMQRSSERCPSRPYWPCLALHCRTTHCPSDTTPPFDAFIIHLLFLSSSILLIGGLLQDCTVFSTSYPLLFTILALSPQTSLQSLDCYISYLACLSQIPTTSSVRLRSRASPLTPLTMANFRQGRSVTLEDWTSLWTPRRLGQRYYAE